MKLQYNSLLSVLFAIGIFGSFALLAVAKSSNHSQTTPVRSSLASLNSPESTDSIVKPGHQSIVKPGHQTAA